MSTINNFVVTEKQEENVVQKNTDSEMIILKASQKKINTKKDSVLSYDSEIKQNLNNELSKSQKDVTFKRINFNF